MVLPYMCIELLKKRSLRLRLSINHSYMAEKITKGITAQIFLSILPFLSINLALQLWYLPNDFCFQDVRSSQI